MCEVKSLRQPRRKMAQRSMCTQYALRLSSRSRSEGHVSEALSLQSHSGSSVREISERRLKLAVFTRRQIHHQTSRVALKLLNGVRHGSGGLQMQNGFRTRHTQVLNQPCRRVLRIKNKKCGAGFHDAQQGWNQRRTSMSEDCNNVPGADTDAGQVVRDLATEHVKLPVGPRHLWIGYGDPIRADLYLSPEEIGNGAPPPGIESRSCIRQKRSCFLRYQGE